MFRDRVMSWSHGNTTEWNWCARSNWTHPSRVLSTSGSTCTPTKLSKVGNTRTPGRRVFYASVLRKTRILGRTSVQWRLTPPKRRMKSTSGSCVSKLKVMMMMMMMMIIVIIMYRFRSVLLSAMLVQTIDN